MGQVLHGTTRSATGSRRSERRYPVIESEDSNLALYGTVTTEL